MNVLVICCDQLRWDCLGCYGNPVIRTPNIDRLARLGALFENAYCTSPLCVPARAQMLTGLPCWQTEVWGLSDRLIPMVPTFANILIENGYFTGAVGKMHFESCNRVGSIHEPHGFQQLILSEEVLPADSREEDDYDLYLRAQGYDLGRYAHGRRSPDFPRQGYEAQVSELPNRHFDTTWTGDQTLTMIREHAREPFCLVCSFVKPHFPCELPCDWPCPYDPQSIPLRASYCPEPNPDAEPFRAIADIQRSTRNLGWLDEATLRKFAAYYYGNIELIDCQVGRILDTLEKLDLLSNTLIIFTSDHGEALGERGCVGKVHHYDESARVPLILAGPPVRQTGRHDRRLAQLEDLCPTILEAGGGRGPAGMTGASLLPLLRDASNPGRPAIFGIIGGSFHFEPAEALCFARDHEWKYMYQFEGGREKLYHIGKDPLELDDRAGSEPGQCARLNQALARWFDDNGAGFLTILGRLRRDLNR